MMNIFNPLLGNSITIIEPVQEKAEVEIEHVLIVDALDLNEIKDKAKKITRMEQWEIKSIFDKKIKGNSPGTVRIRAIDNKEYILGIKRYNMGTGGAPMQALEYETKVTKDAFEIFKGLATVGVIKDRYYFELGGLTLEVDVHLDINGKPTTTWVKVDVEVKTTEKIRFTQDHLPFKVAEIIQNPRTDEQEKKVRGIYKSYFDLYNDSSILPVQTRKEG